MYTLTVTDSKLTQIFVVFVCLFVCMFVFVSLCLFFPLPFFLSAFQLFGGFVVVVVVVVGCFFVVVVVVFLRSPAISLGLTTFG